MARWLFLPLPAKDCCTSVGTPPVTLFHPRSGGNFNVWVYLVAILTLKFILGRGKFFYSNLVHVLEEFLNSRLLPHKLLKIWYFHENTRESCSFENVSIFCIKIPRKTSFHHNHGPWSWKTLPLLLWNQIVERPFLVQHAQLVSIYFAAHFQTLEKTNVCFLAPNISSLFCNGIKFECQPIWGVDRFYGPEHFLSRIWNVSLLLEFQMVSLPLKSVKSTKVSFYHFLLS